MSDLFYDGSELAQSAYARVLLTGDRKVGKSVQIIGTAPRPVAVLNGDGPGAPQAVKRYFDFADGELKILDVTSVDLWKKGCVAAKKMAEDGQIKTIVVDTITLLVNSILAREFGRKFTGFEIWRNTCDTFMAGLEHLKLAPAHVFLISHFGIEDGQITLDGKLKKDVPALVNDIVHLDFKPGREYPRMFNIGPSASGLSGGRSSDENKQIPADVSELLKEFQLEP